MSPPLGINLIQPFSQSTVAFRIGKLAAMIKNAAGETLPQLVRDGLAGDFPCLFFQLSAELFIRFLPACKTDYSQSRWQVPVRRKIIQRRD